MVELLFKEFDCQHLTINLHFRLEKYSTLKSDQQSYEAYEFAIKISVSLKEQLKDQHLELCFLATHYKLEEDSRGNEACSKLLRIGMIEQMMIHLKKNLLLVFCF